ncbi:DNA-binding transcriptional regulator, MarR family [Corynebacterium mycetoides]|uniref:DNA-binding transcriptional regulator, MarR family n=2 Tax=Corynebacterium mycetoides TaxID=38302 RepID=A0A1G9MJY0_9CORY|nr:DNA-binding transcriptional regulator, MarR family [Corynebacterium mycetoides]
MSSLSLNRLEEVSGNTPITRYCLTEKENSILEVNNFTAKANGYDGGMENSSHSRETVYLGAQERQVWDTLISVLVRLPAALDRQLHKDSGLSHFEYQVLSILSERPERTLRMSVLASRVESALPRLSQVVARLEKRGWVTRATDPSDGRYTLATLTDAGMEKVVATAPGHVDMVRRLVFDPLTKTQLRQLQESGRRMLGAIEEQEL